MQDLKSTGVGEIIYPLAPDFAAESKWEKFRQFKSNWDFSTRTLTALNARLNEHFGCDDRFSVLVAGSYGRLDAHPHSDLDFMVIHKGHLEDAVEKVQLIRRCADELHIGAPNTEGAFSMPISFADMLGMIGSKEDTLNSTAQRLLILMEGRPVYNRAFFSHIMDNLVDHYLELLKDEPEKEALVLLNDLIKYFRNICINFDFRFRQDSSHWGIRYLKLRHSRVLIYSGLLFLILTASRLAHDKISFMKEHVHLSPMEKVYLAYRINKDSNFELVLDAYEKFLERLSEEGVRAELGRLDYRSRGGCPHYIELKANSDVLKAELTRFILDNRAQWTPKIFEYLIF